EISLATVLHHACPANDFQLADLRKLGQNVVLHTIGKRAVFFLLAQIFNRQNGNSGWMWLLDHLSVPNHPAASRSERERQSDEECCDWIALHPFATPGESARTARPNRLVL